MLPSVAKPIKKPPAIDPDDFSDDESYYKHRAQMLKYKAWRYSLFCAKNIVQHELPPVEQPDSARKESPGEMSR